MAYMITIGIKLRLNDIHWHLFDVRGADYCLDNLESVDLLTLLSRFQRLSVLVLPVSIPL